MALVRTTSKLDEALAEFNGRLTTDEKARFRALQAVPDASSVIVLTAQLDQAAVKRSGRCIASRVSPLLTSVQQFSGIIGTFVSSNPAIAALVWGSVQFMLRFANNSFSYFDKLSLFLIKIERLCPRFAEYQALYSGSPALQSALSDLYADVIRCCTHACEVLRRSDWVSLLRSALSPFETEFGPFEANIMASACTVKEEIKLAAAKAAVEDRKAQGAHRKIMVRYMQQNENLSLQKLNDKAYSRQRALLDQLSTYNHKTAYHQARLKRHNGTAEWIVVEPEFLDWIDSGVSSLFGLYGKLGCGKTILLSNVISYLHLHYKKTAKIAYFFCRFNEAASLLATTILRSIIQQYLANPPLADDVDATLTKLCDDGLIETKDLASLLGLVFRGPEKHFLIIDGIEECPERERRELLDTLGRAMNASSAPVKLMLSSRNKELEVLHSFTGTKSSLPVRESKVTDDIATYVAYELEERQRTRDLVLGDPNLASIVQSALKAGAQGMFLWVVLQMDELCYQIRDRDILQAIQNLPSTLEETYRRMLGRIAAQRKSEIVLEVFQWIAVAMRPLSLDELHEALAVEKHATFSQSDRFIPQFSRLISWCEGLLVRDEISDELSFTHPTVLQVLTAPNQSTIQFSLCDADKAIGEICTTYLSFDDFKTAIIKRDAKLGSKLDVTADQILTASAVGTEFGRKITKPLLRLTRTRSSSKSVGNPDIGKHLVEARGAVHPHSTQVRGQYHPFLEYASEHWLAHSSRFKKVDLIWQAWLALLLEDDNVACKPWTAEQWSKRDPAVHAFVSQHYHVALLKVVQSSTSQFSHEQLTACRHSAGQSGQFPFYISTWYHAARHKILAEFTPYEFAAFYGYIDVVRLLLQDVTDVDSQMGYFTDALSLACAGGHLEIVKLQLGKGADVNAKFGMQECPLNAAIKGGNADVVKLLLDNGAVINDWMGLTGTAIQFAALYGHIGIAKLLLGRGADVNAKAIDFGNALSAAAGGGHDELVELLIAHGAIIDDSAGEFDRALYDALAKGHQKVVGVLLANTAKLLAKGGSLALGCTLCYAAGRGHSKVVELLIDQGAHVNTPFDRINGNDIPLHYAAYAGQQELVELLLSRGANPFHEGYVFGTPHNAASKKGHTAIAELLTQHIAKGEAPGSRKEASMRRVRFSDAG